MGSEGYLLNQFLAPRTNKRTDAWGGTAGEAPPVAGRDRAPHARGGRVGLHHLLPDVDGRLRRGRPVAGTKSSRWQAKSKQAGATIINTGIGWHEARVPTIVTSVPNSAFVDISNALAEHVDIPVVASNRINMPQAAEQILADTDVSLISMARPLLADPDWVRKAAADRGRRDQHLHRLQPGVPGPRVRAQDGVVSAQPAGRPRDHS